jgi:CheY-like chemotaxis protein/predicted transcriptional regulator
LPSHENGGGSSFSFVVIRRILDVLSNVGQMKKTNLAGKTGLNYPNCIRYIELLSALGWVRSSNDGENHIYLTENGMYFRSLLSRMALSPTTTSSTTIHTDNDNNSSSSSNTGQNRQRLFGTSFLLDSTELLVPAKGAATTAADSRKKLAGSKEKRNYDSNGVIDDNAANKHQYNIMLVDDEPDVLLTYKVTLTSQGYNVDAFPDAKSALKSIASIGPSYYDLVITDIRMKSLNGLQLYHGIRSIDPHVKIIFVSALDAVEELVSILPGVTSKDIIRKPADEKTFVKMVSEALREARFRSSSRLAPTSQVK